MMQAIKRRAKRTFDAVRAAAFVPMMVLMAIAMAAPSVAGQPCNYGIVEIPNTLGGTGSQAFGVSADGRVVVGEARGALFQLRAFRWTAGGGMQDLGALAEGPFYGSQAYGVSANGAVVVGAAQNAGFQIRAFRWTALGGMQDLGTFGGILSEARGVSANGSVVVGTAWNADVQRRAFRWTTLGGMQDLGTLGGLQAIAYSVSADGSVVAGESQNAAGLWRAYRWTAADGMQDLGSLGGPHAQSRAYAVSADGLVVVGSAQNDVGQWRAFRWTVDGGMVEIPDDLDGLESAAYGVSADGSVMVGSAQTDKGEWRAVRWTADGGMFNLGTLGGWGSEAFGVSADGLVVAGSARDAANLSRAFRWADTDGDGIPDDWEINGIPYVDAEGNCRRYPLPGANHMRKDIFIEIDVMTGVPFSESSLAAVRAAFEAAPVDNPDGSTGITLHTIVDETNVPNVAAVTASLMTHYRDTWFGTAAERSDLEATAKLEAKAKVFRHCMFYERMFNAAGNQLLGRAGAIHSDHFAVSLGGTPFDAAKIERYLGSTFMHELGHALGLRHGGNNNVLYKPNYVSVMNYNFDEIQINDAGEWVRVPLDFSREVLDPLNENNLNETVGVPTQFSANYSVPHAYQDAQGVTRLTRVLLGGQPHDWNQNGPPSVYETSVAVDLNRMPPGNPLNLPATNPSPGQTLRGFNDWEAIAYLPPTTRQRGSCEDCDDECLLSVELVEWHDANMPPLPSLCLADLTGDGILDFFDVQLFLNYYASGNLAADFTGDGVLDFFDIQAFLNLYAAGCP